jgi:hypothetical protein
MKLKAGVLNYKVNSTRLSNIAKSTTNDKHMIASVVREYVM